MHVAYIIHNQYGTGPYFKVLEQCAAIVDEGHEVTLVCTSKTKKLRSHRSEIRGVTVYQAPDLLFGELRQGVDLYNALRRMFFLWRLKPDLIHAIDCRPNVIFPALLAKYTKRKPMVLSWWDLFGGGGLATERSGALYSATLGKVETWFEEHFRRYADGATTITTFLRDRLVGMGYPDEKTIVQHVGCDTNVEVPSTQEARNQLGLTFENPVLCFSGTIYKTDFALLLQALEIVRRSYDYTLLWIGSYSISPEICEEYNIVKTGYLKTLEEVYTYLAASDVCVLPMKINITNKARWHSKVSDYFNAGKSVVSTPISDFPTIFAQNNVGWMSKDDSPQAFAEVLMAALASKDQWESKGVNARTFVREQLDTHVIAKDLIEFYQQVQKK